MMHKSIRPNSPYGSAPRGVSGVKRGRFTPQGHFHRLIRINSELTIALSRKVKLGPRHPASPRVSFRAMELHVYGA